MRARTLLFLFLALGAASLAAVFARGLISSQRAAIASKPAAPAIAATEVLVAGHAVPAGQFLKAEDLSWQVWPEGTLADGYVTKANGSTEPFIGAVVRTGFAAGEPVTEARVAKPGDRGFLAAVLMPGMRAVTVAVNPTTGVSGFVLPGDRVDVLVTHTLPAQGTERRTINATETAIDDVRVIAVDQSTNDQAGTALLAKTVTLEATPKQAEILSLIAQMGKISLSLRSLAVAQAAGPRQDVTQPPAPAKAAPRHTYTVDTEASALLSRQAPIPTVQVVRGGKTKMEGGAAAPAGTVLPEDGETPVPESDPAIETSGAEAAAAVARLP